MSDYGDEDIFTFDGTSAQRVYYDGILDFGSGSNSVSTRLSGPDSFSIPAGSNSEVVTLADGTYQLKVIDFTFFDRSNRYGFRFLDVADAPKVNYFCNTVNGRIDRGAETDLYRFTALLGLSNGLSFGDLTITNDSSNSDTLIKETTTDNTLAILSGIDSSVIDRNDFVLV